MSIIRSKSVLFRMFVLACSLFLVIPAVNTFAAEKDSVSTKPVLVDAVIKVGSTTAVVNGKKMTIQPIYDNKGVMMVPVSLLIRAFHLNYSYDRSDKTLRFDTRMYSYHHITAQIGKVNGSDNSKGVKLSAAPVEKMGSIMVPLRNMVELLGGTVAYKASTKEVRILAYENPILDAEKRIGDSRYSWSMSALNQMEVLPKTETDEWQVIKGKYNKGNIDGFSVFVKVTEKNEDLTLEGLRQQGITLIGEQIFKHPAGDFIVTSTKYQIADPWAGSKIVNEQTWRLEKDGHYYYIKFYQENNGMVENYYAELERIAHKVMETFQTTIDVKDSNLIDVASPAKR